MWNNFDGKILILSPYPSPQKTYHLIHYSFIPRMITYCYYNLNFVKDRPLFKIKGVFCPFSFIVVKYTRHKIYHLNYF